MHAAAQPLVGRHDFTTFRASECQAEFADAHAGAARRAPRRRRASRSSPRARSFLHNQVRSMAGSLEHVGSGKWSAEDLALGALGERPCALRTGRAAARSLSRCRRLLAICARTPATACRPRLPRQPASVCSRPASALAALPASSPHVSRRRARSRIFLPWQARLEWEGSLPIARQPICRSRRVADLSLDGPLRVRAPRRNQPARPADIRRANRDDVESRPSPSCDDFMTKNARFEVVRPTGE